jgi:hypothetical protein
MLIGQDFQMIKIEVFGLLIQEPNVFLSDFIMSVVSFLLGILLIRKTQNSVFEKWWVAFFVLYGISSMLGAFGHGFYHYFGVFGKMPNWLTGIPIVYLIEIAMISLIRNSKKKKTLAFLALIKMVLVYLIFAWICFTFPIQENPKTPFLPVAFNTFFGVTLSAGILGYKFYKKEASFKLIFMGVIVMIPSAFIFIMKINPTPWFDKNDFSHLFLTIGIIFFYLGIIKVKKSGFLQHQATT